MKFIGQYIQGLISRFRNTVFFETDTIMMSDLPTADPGVKQKLC
jgi:hypothetical protein